MATRWLPVAAVLAAGLRSMAELRLRGVPILQGATIERFEGEERLAALAPGGDPGSHRY